MPPRYTVPLLVMCKKDRWVNLLFRHLDINDFLYFRVSMKGLVAALRHTLLRALQPQLRSKCVVTRANIIRAFARMVERGDSTFLTSIQHALADSDDEIRLAVVESLWQACYKDPLREGVAGGLENLCMTMDQINLVLESLTPRMRDRMHLVRAAAVTCYSRLCTKGDPRAVSALSGPADDPVDFVRAHVIKALSLVAARGDRTAIGCCVRLSSDSAVENRRSALVALEALADHGDGAATECVALALADTAPVVREAALQILPRVAARGSAEAVAGLLVLLHDPDTVVRRNALETLAEVAAIGDPAALDGISLCVEDEQSRIRAAAVRTTGHLARRTDVTAVGRIVSRLDVDKDELVRVAAVQAIEPFAALHGTAVNILRRCVDDERDPVRVAAISVLSRVVPRGDRTTIERIVARLEDRSELVRNAAVRALGAITERGDAATIARILEFFGNTGARDVFEDRKAGFRESALLALAQVITGNDSGALALIVSCLRDRVEFVRRAAVEALAQVAVKGDAAIMREIAGLLDDDDEQVQIAALSTLAELSEKGCVWTIQVIKPSLTKRTEGSRVAAAEAVARVAEQGNEDVVQSLLTAIERGDRYREATRAAVQALAQLAPRGHADAVEDLCGLCGAEPAKPEGVRLAAVEALAVVAEPESRPAIQALIARLDDANRRVRRSAVVALAALGGHRAEVRRAIEVRLEDSVDEVRTAAATALGDLDPSVPDEQLSFRPPTRHVPTSKKANLPEPFGR